MTSTRCSMLTYFPIQRYCTQPTTQSIIQLSKRQRVQIIQTELSLNEVFRQTIGFVFSIKTFWQWLKHWNEQVCLYNANAAHSTPTAMYRTAKAKVMFKTKNVTYKFKGSDASFFWQKHPSARSEQSIYQTNFEVKMNAVSAKSVPHCANPNTTLST